MSPSILSIQDGHNASIATYVDGVINFSLSEERPTRVKNYYGFPWVSIDNSLKANQLSSVNDYDHIVFYRNSVIDLFLFRLSELRTDNLYTKMSLSVLHLFASNLPDIAAIIDKFLPKSLIKNYYAKKLCVDASKIILYDHHLCHAYASLCFHQLPDKELVFTLDAEGDLTAGSVCIKNSLSSLAKVQTIKKRSSIGHMYLKTTRFLGMKPNQHEFKVMGLAPYAKDNNPQFVQLSKKLLGLFSTPSFDKGFTSRINMSGFQFERWMSKNFKYMRFDNISAALQYSVENLILTWISSWIEKTGITKVRLSGGVFMNVKLNQKVHELKDIQQVVVCPSSGDETTVLGAIYATCLHNSYPVPLVNDLYLGNSFSDNEIEKSLVVSQYSSPISYKYHHNIQDVISTLLIEKKIIARFSGREEFGARALGNRSILCHPSDPSIINVINEMIKDRDFWMPFTPSILEEYVNDYIINPLSSYSPYMSSTFMTRDLATHHFAAAIHPADKTMRCQMVRESWNPDYHLIISNFYNSTGIPGLLNTSFNLHGEPNVHYPIDALKTLCLSKLDFLAIGNFLVWRKS